MTNKAKPTANTAKNAETAPAEAPTAIETPAAEAPPAPETPAAVDTTSPPERPVAMEPAGATEPTAPPAATRAAPQMNVPAGRSVGGRSILPPGVDPVPYGRPNPKVD